MLGSALDCALKLGLNDVAEQVLCALEANAAVGGTSSRLDAIYLHSVGCAPSTGLQFPRRR